MKTKTAKQILRKCMSKKYCNGTRYDFLDPEEIVMIIEAMEIYADQELTKQKNKLFKPFRFQ